MRRPTNASNLCKDVPTNPPQYRRRTTRSVGRISITGNTAIPTHPRCVGVVLGTSSGSRDTENGLVGFDRLRMKWTLILDAAKVRYEFFLPNAAVCTRVRFGDRRDDEGAQGSNAVVWPL